MKNLLRRLKRRSLREFRRHGLALTANDRRLAALRDIHRGRRAFVLGNGPSLKVADLTRLQNEVTLASNKVFVAFSETPWRPTYYFVCDRLVARNNAEIIRQLPLTKLASDRVAEDLGDDSGILWYHMFGRNGLAYDHQSEADWDTPAPHFSTDAFVGVDDGATVIYAQLQLAYYMGIREVVLLGVDFSFQLPASRTATSLQGYETSLVASGEMNHFHPDYRKPGEVWAMPNLLTQHRAFLTARNAFKEAGGCVINASRQTKLDVFLRGDLDQLLQSAGPAA